MHGDRDPLVPSAQRKGGGHGFGGPEIDARVDQFFDRHLKIK
jgi:hypothetical protein